MIKTSLIMMECDGRAIVDVGCVSVCKSVQGMRSMERVNLLGVAVPRARQRKQRKQAA